MTLTRLTMAATYCWYSCMHVASVKKSSCTEAVGLQDTNWSTLPVLFQLLVSDRITYIAALRHLQKLVGKREK